MKFLILVPLIFLLVLSAKDKDGYELADNQCQWWSNKINLTTFVLQDMRVFPKGKVSSNWKWRSGEIKEERVNLKKLGKKGGFLRRKVIKLKGILREVKDGF